MTNSIDDSGAPLAIRPQADPGAGARAAAGKQLDRVAELGPDPVVGAGIALLGIFLMGTGGARDAHYVFDVGVLTAVSGAAIFVLFIALSAMKQRRAEEALEESE